MWKGSTSVTLWTTSRRIWHGALASTPWRRRLFQHLHHLRWLRDFRLQELQRLHGREAPQGEHPHLDEEQLRPTLPYTAYTAVFKEPTYLYLYLYRLYLFFCSKHTNHFTIVPCTSNEDYLNLKVQQNSRSPKPSDNWQKRAKVLGCRPHGMTTEKLIGQVNSSPKRTRSTESIGVRERC